MSYKKYVIVLSDVGNRHRVVKLSGCFDGVSNVTVECKSAAEKGVGTLYILADKIAQIRLERNKSEYKVPILANNDILCALEEEGVLQVGGTGRVPSFRAVGERIKAWEKSLEKSAEQTQSVVAPKQVEEQPRQSVLQEPKSENETQVEYDGDTEADAPQTEAENRQDLSKEFNNFSAPKTETGFATEKGFVAESGYAADSGLKDEPQPKDESRTEPSFWRKAEAQSKKRSSNGRQNAADGEEYVTAAADVIGGAVDYVGDNFYFAIKPQLDEMFVCYPEEQTLNAVVPNSRWVRVDTADGYYVVGLLYDLETVLYICYGIPSSFNAAPPPEIADVCVWLPLDVKRREGDGYWVIYQSAVDGKCVR